MKMSNILIVDANNRMHASYHAYKRLTYNGKSVAMIFGLPSMIKYLVGKFNPTRLYMVWDGAKSKERLSILPSYKDRTAGHSLIDMDDLYRQRDICQKMFHYLGVRQIYNKTMEADDNIYYLQRILKKKFPKANIIIVSGDKDFHQLIDKRVSVWDDNKKKLYTPKNLFKERGYTPEQTVDYLSLLGDKSDNIPGYPGIGEKKAPQFLEQFGSISSFLSNSSNKFSKIDHNKLLEVYKINQELIDLKYFYLKYIKGKTKLVYYKNIRKPKLKEEKFKQICIKYNLNKVRGKDFINTFKNLQ